MKKNVKLISVILLTALYCLAMGAVTQSLVTYTADNTGTSNEVQLSYNKSNNSFFQTLQTENTIDIPSNTNVPSDFKNPFQNFLSPTIAIAQTTEVLYSKHINTSLNFLIQLKKSSLLYPFHFFW